MLTQEEGVREALESAVHKAIRKVSEDVENLKFNTAIAALMALINDIYDSGSITRGELRVFTILLNPFAPHMTEEVWESNGLGEGMVACQQWPAYDPEKCKEDTVELAVQLNGKLRARIQVPADVDKDAAIAAARQEEHVAKALEGLRVLKEIYVPGKLVNLVAKP